MPRPSNDDAAQDTALRIAAQSQRRWLGELREWLAVPSISADPGCAAAVARAAHWLRAWLQARGAQVWLLPTRTGGAVVVGHFAGPGEARPVLLYGHYDVQPPGPGWSRDPFRPVVVGTRLYGRGTADDKGQLFAHLAAVDAWLRAGGLPVGVVVVAEGAEEVGSPGFATAARWVARRWRPAVVLVSDTERAGEAVPSVTVSQRGQLRLQLAVDVGGAPVHPGRLGGAVLDPSVLLSQAVVSLRAGLATLPDGEPPSSGVAVRARSDEQLRRAASGRMTAGERLDRRVTRRTTLSVLSMHSGGRDGSAVPTRAVAEIDVRTAPGMSHKKIMGKMHQALAPNTPVSAALRFSVISCTPGLEALPSASVRQIVDKACRVGYGAPAVYLRSGGTIPAVGVLAALFATRPLLLGLGSPGGRAHGPDEFLDIEGWRRGVHTSIALLNGLAKARRLNTC